MNLISKLGWIAAASLGLFVVATFAGIVSAGPLDPDAPPAPSMVTQNELPPAWHQMLSATGGCDSERFDCVMTSDFAVLDRETGLVWQRIPTATTSDWASSIANCLVSTIAGRGGWRLPTMEELRTLYPLPSGHPFTPGTGAHWTVTTNALDSTVAWQVTATGAVTFGSKGTAGATYWCVRGSHGYDAY